MLKTEAIKNFLLNVTHSDLSSLYTPGMECQCNVAQDGGQRVEGDYKGRQWHGWTDNVTTWKSFRIPWNAGSAPEYQDKPITFDIARHAEGIGMTGWDWEKRVSRWVAYDYDAITGHADSHIKKLTDEQLIELEEAIQDVPWVTLRYSTSGKGRHLYVPIEPIRIQNHTEHAALARAILGMLSGITGYDFVNRVDVVGGNMWVWHRKMQGTNGLTLIKEATTLLEAPANWKDHIAVVKGKRKRIIPEFIEQDSIELFDELSIQHQKVSLDSGHMRLLEWLRENHLQSWWDSDNHLLVTHTAYLAKAHEELNFKGIFKTLATGSEYGVDHNCFLYPMRRGSWVCRRYSRGVAEAETWEQDARGWTRCYYNIDPDFDTVCRAYGGQLSDRSGYIFREAELAQHAMLKLGISMDMATFASSRHCTVKQIDDNKIAAYIERQENDSPDKMGNWIPDKKLWKKVFIASKIRKVGTSDIEIQNFDDVLRHLVTEKGEYYGWYLKNDNESWNKEPFEHMKVVLEAMGSNVKEVKQILGACVLKSWRLTNRPFEPEYPEARMWNRDAAQFLYTPNYNDDRSFPTWLKILNHIGQGLNDAINENEWCRSNGIITGADYLKVWIASLFQYPRQQLPYLFLYGEQNCGKSILHESLRLLLSRGVARADNAITNPQGFNGELEHSVLSVIEETDLSTRKAEVYNRIKDWVTAREIPIHIKRMTPYTIPNTTHWIQVANNREYCPVFPGDSRIIVIEVPPLAIEEIIPKKHLEVLLQKEAPDFMGEMLKLEIPESNDRLNVPVIETAQKSSAQQSNMSTLDLFVHEHCHYVPGSMILLKDFVGRFHEWLPADEVGKWGKIMVGKSLPSPYGKGHRRSDNQVCVINISWDPNTQPGTELFINKEGKIDEKRLRISS